MALTFLNFYLHANRLKYKLHLTSCQVVLRTFYFFKLKLASITIKRKLNETRCRNTLLNALSLRSVAKN